MFKDKEILEEIKEVNNMLETIIRKIDAIIIVSKNNKFKSLVTKKEKGGKE